MRVSRRGILAGLLATSTAPAAVINHTSELPPELPKPTFIKGMILPRYNMVPDPRYAFHNHNTPAAMVVVEYQIFDGEKFVPLNSGDGQRVVDELSGRV